MAYIESGTADNFKSLLRIGPYKKSARISTMPFGPAYAVSAVTGTIAAALAANSSVFISRFSPNSGSLNCYISKIILTWTTIVTFTTPITAGRRLALFRGAGAQPSGGTAIPLVFKKTNLDPNSRMQTTLGGDMRIATTAGLTVTGITFDTTPIATMSVVDVGTAGASKTQVFEFDRAAGSTLVLQPGQLISIRNPVIMDAAGTWQLAVTMEWYEG